MAAYDITQLQSLNHEATIYAIENSCVAIDSTHFILAFSNSIGGDLGAYIRTFSVNTSYEMTTIDTVQHDLAVGGSNSLVKIDDTHFALAYTGTGNDGFLKIFSVDESYAITEVSTLEHDTDNCLECSLVKIDSTHFILAYSGETLHGYIKTFSIDGSYAITQIDSLEHDAALGRYNSLAMIDSTHFILAYSGTDSDGYIKTFSIDGSYDNIAEINSVEHDTVNGQENTLVMIDSTHCMLAYAGEGTDGYIKTFLINGSYQITEIDSLEHDAVRGGENSLIKLNNTHVALAFKGTDLDGFLKIFSVDGSYQITQVSSLEHDTSDGGFNSICELDSTHYVVAYAGAGYRGYVKTFFVDAYNIEEYPVANQDADENMGGSQTYIAGAQTFTATNSKKITSSKFYVKKFGSPTGDMISRLYLTTGTVGTDAVPTGSPLVSSDTVAISGITTDYQLIEFLFSTRYKLTSGTDYAITVEYNGGDSDNYLIVGVDESSPVGKGARKKQSDDSWETSLVEHIFYLYAEEELYGVTLNTNAATDITDESAIISGDITDAGLAGTDNHIYLEWGETVTDNSIDKSTGGVATYTSTLTGLEPETTYYFRIKVTNVGGVIYYGDTLNFTTEVAPSLGGFTKIRGFNKMSKMNRMGL